MPAVRLIFTLIILLDGLWWYLIDRRLRPLRRARLWRILLGAFMATMLLMIISRFIPPRWSWQVNRYVPLPLLVSVYLWHLGVMPTCMLGGLILRMFRRRSHVEPGESELSDFKSQNSSLSSETSEFKSRRRFLTAAAAVTPPLALAATTGFGLSQLGKFRIRAFDLKIPSLPPMLDGLVIAHLSDFHAGRLMTAAAMRPVIDAVNEMSPDMVLLTGDLIDYALRDLPFALDEVKRLRPRLGFEHGVAMCMGNHDWIENRFAFKQMVDAARVPLIVDKMRGIDVRGQKVQLIGVDWAPDQAETAEMVRQAGAKRDRSAFPILLAHHPHAFDAAAAAGLPLTLSGHTHGGQIMLTERMGAGAMIFRYWSGVYRKPNGSQLVVSNGIGNWFPLRINAPAEVLRLTLRRA